MTIRVCLALILLVGSIPNAICKTMSETEARGWCDSDVLEPVEGIWEYPSDETKVLIKRDTARPGAFVITVLETPDCRLEPGDVIGCLYASADGRQFRLEQMTRKKISGLIHPKDCVATLSSDGESLKVKSPRLKLKITPYTLLPRFWRIIRVSERNPADDLPVGLIKLYPGYDRNGSLRRFPRVL